MPAASVITADEPISLTLCNESSFTFDKIVHSVRRVAFGEILNYAGHSFSAGLAATLVGGLGLDVARGGLWSLAMRAPAAHGGGTRGAEAGGGWGGGRTLFSSSRDMPLFLPWR